MEGEEGIVKKLTEFEEMEKFDIQSNSYNLNYR